MDLNLSSITHELFDLCNLERISLASLSLVPAYVK